MKRLLLRIALVCFSIVIMVVGIVFFWLFVYPGDLPNLGLLARFAPSQPTQVVDACSGISVTSIPYDSIGGNLLAAMRVAETNEASPTTLNEILGPTSTGHTSLPVRISRSLFCTRSRILNRDLAELRMALHIERRFSDREMFTIFANRARFGQNLEGVWAASRYYFDRDPAQLDLAQAALLAALVKAPAYYSPVAHPDRAVQRRNEILDAMVAANAMSAERAKEAKTSPLGVSIIK